MFFCLILFIYYMKPGSGLRSARALLFINNSDFINFPEKKYTYIYININDMPSCTPSRLTNTTENTG